MVISLDLPDETGTVSVDDVEPIESAVLDGLQTFLVRFSPSKG